MASDLSQGSSAPLLPSPTVTSSSSPVGQPWKATLLPPQMPSLSLEFPFPTPCRQAPLSLQGPGRCHLFHRAILILLRKIHGSVSFGPIALSLGAPWNTHSLSCGLQCRPKSLTSWAHSLVCYNLTPTLKPAPRSTHKINLTE